MKYRNSEGYSDPTAGLAMSHVMKEYRQKQRKLYADKNRKKIYVASRYAGDIHTNVRNAIKYCRYVIDKDCMPIASHLLYPQILDDSVPEQRDLGLMFGLALLATCQEIWCFGEISKGMQQEINEAKRLHIPVKYIKEASV